MNVHNIHNLLNILNENKVSNDLKSKLIEKGQKIF